MQEHVDVADVPKAHNIPYSDAIFGINPHLSRLVLHCVIEAI